MVQTTIEEISSNQETISTDDVRLRFPLHPPHPNYHTSLSLPRTLYAPDVFGPTRVRSHLLHPIAHPTLQFNKALMHTDFEEKFVIEFKLRKKNDKDREAVKVAVQAASEEEAKKRGEESSMQKKTSNSAASQRSASKLSQHVEKHRGGDYSDQDDEKEKDRRGEREHQGTPSEEGGNKDRYGDGDGRGGGMDGGDAVNHGSLAVGEAEGMDRGGRGGDSRGSRRSAADSMADGGARRPESEGSQQRARGGSQQRASVSSRTSGGAAPASYDV